MKLALSAPKAKGDESGGSMRPLKEQIIFE